MSRREQGWKDEKGSEPRCVELIGDGADEVLIGRTIGRALGGMLWLLSAIRVPTDVCE